MLPRPSWLLLAAAVLPLAIAASVPGNATTNPLAAHLWKDRVLLVVADEVDDSRLQQQKTIFQSMNADARERDLKLVIATGASAEAEEMRQRFGLGSGFHALLIGKDGGAKLTAGAPLGPESLLPLIDAMPMRQEEMRRRS